MVFPFFILVPVIFLLAFGLFFVIFKKNRLQKESLAALHEILLLVTIPQRYIPEPGKTANQAKEYIAKTDQFFTSLVTLLEHSQKMGWPPLALETSVHLLDEEIHFYFAVPEKLVDDFSREIHSFYPDAHIEPAQEYNLFHPSGGTSASFITLEKEAIFPLKNYTTLEVDPLLSLMNGLAKLEKEGEGAAIQIILKPGSPSVNERAMKVAKRISEGKPLKEALKSTEEAHPIGQALAIGGEIFGSKSPEPKKEQPAAPLIAGPAAEHMAKTLQEKAEHHNFRVNIRLITSASNKQRSDMILSGLENSLSQFSNPGINSLKPKRVSGNSLKKLVYNFSFRIFNSNEEIILSSQEIASVWHLPSTELPAPKIKWLKARSAEPPSDLPEQGIIIGETKYRGEKRAVRMANEDRRRHFYIIGQTGTGKSTLMQEMIRQDMESGHGITVIDPHGTLVEPLLGLVPKKRAEDVIYFNPGLTERPLGLNMLEWETEEQKDFAVSEMIAIFMKLFPPEYIGPMFEHDMRNAMLTIMADKENPGTIVEIPRIFTDKEFMKLKLSKVYDPLVRAYWEREAAQTSDFHKSEKLGYLISKLSRFIENSMMRNILGQSRSSFNFSEAINSNKIILVNLAKGKIGETNAYLLGLIIVSKLLIAAFSRVDIAEEMRRDFYLYIDEFQNFTTDTVASILAEARKYRLNLTIAHQFIGQLPQNIKDAVFGNVGSLLSFRVGPDDADFLSKQFAPVFSASDLVNIENFNAYFKPLINGYPARPFNLHTFKEKNGNAQWAEQIMALSVTKYGRPKEVVEQEIKEKLQSVLTVAKS